MEEKNRVLDETEILLKEKFDDETLNKIMTYARKRYLELKEENSNDPDCLKCHTERQIFPAISLYEALLKINVSNDDATEILDNCFKTRAEVPAAKIRKLLKVPGLYHLIPAIFKKTVVKRFGENAGFKTKFYNTNKNESKFDMLRCPYYEICKKYNCENLTKCFCHTDDVAYSNMHKYIHWNRTKTIGLGSDLCDFDIIVEKNDNNKNK